MSQPLQLELLGHFQLIYQGKQLELGSSRAQELLAYLLLHRQQPQLRQQIAFAFWPDSDDAQARTNLRQLLHHLRLVLPEAETFIDIRLKTLQWRPNAPYQCDCEDFETLFRQATNLVKESNAAASKMLETAIAIYQGSLLPSSYEEWVLAERERFHQKALETLELLINLLEQETSFNKAIDYAEHLLRLDPLQETTYKKLLDLHALKGDRASALHIYHRCANIFQHELGIEPSLSLRKAFDELLDAETEPTLSQEQTASITYRLPLIGRKDSWEKLLACWNQAKIGQTHFVLIAGEAGIGKTRLAEELLDWVARRGYAQARTRSFATEGQLAYTPIVELLRSEALKEGYPNEVVWLSELSRLLPEVLVRHPDVPNPEPLNHNWQRQRLFEAIAQTFQKQVHPLLLLLDDLQWCDQESLQFLQYLLLSSKKLPLLILGTLRQETYYENQTLVNFVLALQKQELLTSLPLKPLQITATTKLAEIVLNKNLSESQEERLFKDTEGNPLFIIESARAGLLDLPFSHSAVNTENSSPNLIPPKIQAVIEERFSQLSQEAKMLVDIAAVIGQAFDLNLLLGSSQLSEINITKALDELWRRQIIKEHSFTAYDFSHDRIREVAYAKLSRPNAQFLHRQVARALRNSYENNLDSVANQLAYHYERAGMLTEAIQAYYQAAEVASKYYAHAEAIRHLQRGIDLLQNFPPSKKTLELELSFQASLGISHVATKGYSGSEVEETLARAKTLSGKIGAQPSAPLLRALAITALSNLNLSQAVSYGKQLENLAQATQSNIICVEANYVLGVSTFWQGSFLTSKLHFEQALTSYRPENLPLHISNYSQDPKIICMVRLAFSLWYLGYPDNAWSKVNEALACARNLDHSPTLLYILHIASAIAALKFDLQATRDYAVEACILAEKSQSTYWLHGVKVFKTWALTSLKNKPTDFSIFEEYWNSSLTGLNHIYITAIMAKRFLQLGKWQEGLACVEWGLDYGKKHNLMCDAFELTYLKGLFLLNLHNDYGEAEKLYHQTIAIAQKQEAKWVELLAVTALCQLWQKQGKKHEAFLRLSEIYSWFSEGFDNPDLKAAKALLEQLV